MKKFFTMIGAALLLGSLAAQAETVEFYVDAVDDDGNEFTDASFISELIKNEDGSFTIKEFFNSGYPVSFTLKPTEMAEAFSIKMCKNIYQPEGYDFPYLMTSDDFTLDEEGMPPLDAYMTCYSYPEGGTGDEYTTVWYPYVDDAEDPAYSSYAIKYDSEEWGFDYYGCIILSGTLDSGDYAPWYYISFPFSDPEDAGVNSVESNADAPAVFYDLTGKRVENPSNGIFIRKQGSVVKKVAIKK